MSMSSNKFGIPESQMQKIRRRDLSCAYCHKQMFYPCVGDNKRDWATIEHLNSDGPFYWATGLKIEDIVVCCGSCNSSRGAKPLPEWFSSSYCESRGINSETVADPVRQYLRRKKITNVNTA